MDDDVYSVDVPLARVVGGKVNLKTLIKELDEMYPDVFPDSNISERDLAFRSGCIHIVRFLKSKLE
jgi:hypothetical protein